MAEPKAVKPAAPAPLPLWLTMPLSGTAGLIAWLPSHPFEIVKNRMILPTADPSHTTGRVFADLRATDGVAGGWYKGIEAGMARQVVYTSCRLAFFDPVKRLIVGDRQATVFDRILAGASSGALAAFCSSPVEVALVRMSAASAAERASLPATMLQIGRDNGVGGYWRGCVPLMTRAAIVGVSQVAFYDQVKSIIVAWNRANNGGLSVNAENLSSSVTTGIFYGFVTMPVEVARVRISADKVGRYKSMPQTIVAVAKEDGVSTLFRAITPYLGRCTIHTVCSFMILENFKRAASTWYNPTC